MQNKRAVVFWCILIVIGICVGIFFGVQAILRANAVAPFQKDLDGYLALNNVGPPVEPCLGPSGPLPRWQTIGKVRGQMITVDVKAKGIDYFYFDLPDELRAPKPEDARTVVLLTWDKVEVGSYGAGGPKAYVQTCSVKVVDKETKSVIATGYVPGADPPHSKKSSESGTGPKPIKELVSNLKNLPRQ
jgi:hypothetical protein